MKTKIVTLLLLISVTVIAQFPAPHDFQFGYSYIEMGNWGVCNGKGVNGPTYCSSFAWGIPDTTSTTARLSKYKIYYKNYGGKPYVIDSTTNNYYSGEMGIIGFVWVTAVYTNPVGESAASNIIENNSLPIRVKDLSESEKIKFRVDAQNRNLILDAESAIKTLKVVNSQGRTVLEFVNPTQYISVKDIARGVYIILINDMEGKIYHNKIIL